MPWMKVRSENGDKVQVFKRGADGRPEGPARGTFRGEDADDRAEDQMNRLRQAEITELQQGQKYAGLSLTPPAGVRAVCQRGLAQDGGTEMQRDTAQKIAAGQALSPRTVRAVAKQFSKGRKDGDDQAYLLRGGDPGQSWFKTIAAALDQVDAVEATKSMTTSEAGSAGFSVPDDDDGVGKAVTMRKGMDVWVKQTNEVGVIKAVKQYGATVKYRVETPSGFYLCGRKAIESAAQKAVKDAAKAYAAVQAAESDVTAETVEDAVRSFAATWKIAGAPQRIQMQKAYDALTAAKAVMKASPEAVDQVKSFLAMAKAELQPFTKATQDENLNRAIYLLRMASSSINHHDHESTRYAQAKILIKADNVLTELAMDASPNAARIIRSAQEILMQLDESDAIYDPDRTPVSLWKRVLGDALGKLYGVAKLRGIPAKAEVDPLTVPVKAIKAMTPTEDAEIESLRRQHRYLADMVWDAADDELPWMQRRLAVVTERFTTAVKAIMSRTEEPVPVRAFATIKAVVGAIAEQRATLDEQEQMLDAVDALREYAAAHGGETAVKSLVPLEEELYAEPDEGLSDWQQRVVRMIDEYQAKIALEAPQV